MPEDYTKTSYSTKTVDLSFNLDLIDPCPFTTLMSFEIEDMERFVYQPELARVIVTDVPDTVSLNHDNSDGLTFCGPRKYDLLLPEGTDNFLDYDQLASTLTLKSDNEADVSEHEIGFIIYLKNYPEVSR